MKDSTKLTLTLSGMVALNLLISFYSHWYAKVCMVCYSVAVLISLKYLVKFYYSLKTMKGLLK